jgi:hypothetical protein
LFFILPCFFLFWTCHKFLFWFRFSSSKHVKDKSRSRDWKIKGKQRLCMHMIHRRKAN